MNAQKCDPVLRPFAGDVLERCDAGQLEAFAERAAILEFEAGIQPRGLAESLAVLDLLRQFPSLITGLSVLQVELDGATQWLLTADLELARQYLADIGGNETAVLDPAEVVRAQYGSVALLGTLG